MTEKRFTVHITWFNYDKTEGEITLKDNGQPLLESECIEDVQRVKVLFNELNDENKKLKQDLKELSDENEQLRKENDMFSCELSVSANKEISRNCRIAELKEENEQLKEYKQSVNDTLKSWSQKNVTAKQLEVVLAIMEELNVIGDVE